MALMHANTDDMTPAERRRVKMRDAIIAAAEKVFAREGAEGVSIRRIANLIDYSPAAIYKYFKSKDDLQDAMREAFFERLVAKMSDVDLSQPVTTDLVKDCLMQYTELGLEHPHHYMMAFSGVSPKEKTEEDTYAFQAYRWLTEVIVRGQNEGAFRKTDPVATASSIWASMHGFTMLCVHLPNFPNGIVGAEHLSREGTMAFHAETVARGLSA